MYRVELIPKTSTLDDIVDQWRKTGREYNGEGEFVFDDAQSVDIDRGVVTIYKDMNTYHYNMQDFYRIKTIYIQ